LPPNERPQHLTVKRRRLAEIIANDRAESVTDAAQQAGMHRVAASRALQTVPVQREIERLKEVRSDKARALREISARKLRSRLEADPSDQLLLGAYKVTTDALASGVDEEQDQVTEEERAKAQRYVARAFELGRRWERRLHYKNAAVAAPIVEDSADAVIVESSEVAQAQSVTELTYGPLSDHTSGGDID
jgi:hypothetical protein